MARMISWNESVNQSKVHLTLKIRGNKSGEHKELLYRVHSNHTDTGARTQTLVDTLSDGLHVVKVDHKARESMGILSGKVLPRPCPILRVSTHRPVYWKSPRQKAPSANPESGHQ